MFVPVLAAEADDTRSAITFLIVCLIGIAVLLSLLTIWYWRYTSPHQRLVEAAAPAIVRKPAPVLAGAGKPAGPGGGPSKGAPPRGRPVKPRLRPGRPNPVPLPITLAEHVGTSSRIEVEERIHPERVDIEPRPTPAPTITPTPTPTGEPLVAPSPAGEPIHAAATAATAAPSPAPTLVLGPGVTSRVSAPPRPGTRLDVRSPVGGEAAEGDDVPALSDDAWAAAMRSAFDRLNAER